MSNIFKKLKNWTFDVLGFVFFVLLEMFLYLIEVIDISLAEKLEDHRLLIPRKRSNNAKPLCKRMVRHLLVLQEHRRCQ